MEIREEVQRTAACFHAVFPLDIEVVDAQMRTVTACLDQGRQPNPVCAACGGTQEHHPLGRREIVVMDNTGSKKSCGVCQSSPQCEKLACVYSPILVEDEMAGSILVSAWEPSQASLIQTQSERILALLAGMREHIALQLRHLQEQRRLKDMEALMEAALNHLHDGALVLDSSQQVVYINARGQNLLGINARQWAYLKRIKQVQWNFQKRSEDGTEEYLFTMHGASQRLRCRVASAGGEGREAYRLAVFSILPSLPQSAQPFSRDDVFCPLDRLIGRSAAFLATAEQCYRTAYSAGCTMIQGETGTGKEALARSIHWEGPYRENRFVRIGNNAEFRDLVCRIGLNAGDRSAAHGTYLDIMRGCTLYMDEISTLDHYHQDKLLMIIQDSLVSGFKVICATSCDLRQPIAKGEFHENLYYALGRDVISVPPLRERPEDIRLFAQLYMARYNSINNKRLTLSGELLAKLERYGWLGNLNELESFIAHAVECCPETDGALLCCDLPGAMRERLTDDSPRPYRLDDAEKQLILKCLNDAGTGAHSKTDAARALGISLATLYRKIKQYDIQEKTKFADL